MPSTPESADYPHIIHPEETWKEIHLYSISGFVTQEIAERNTRFYGTVSKSFGGLFKYNPNSRQLIGAVLVGERTATIEGKMTPKRLVFLAEECDLRYPQLIDDSYDFRFRRQDNLWRGGEHIELGPGKKEFLKAQLTTTLFSTNAFGIDLGDFARAKHWANSWEEPLTLFEQPLATD